MNVREVKNIYRSGRDNLGADFFGLCLNACSEYKRAAGFFSSSALASWAAGLPRIVVDSDIKLYLIISPELSENDIQVLRDSAGSVQNEFLSQEMIDRYLHHAIDYSESQENKSLRLELFGWLLKSKKLEMKLAIMNPEYGSGIYHEKYGIFNFQDGDKIAFIGSANESQQAYERNGELIMVFRNWLKEDASRIDELEWEFDEAWAGKIQGLSVFSPSSSVIDRFAKIAKHSGDSPPNNIVAEEQQQLRPAPWDHQQQAIDAFLEKEKGVLEMATGTGKTRTALEIIVYLLSSGSINSFIVVTKGNDLLNQWYLELLQWRGTDHLWKRVYRHYKNNKEKESYILQPSESCLVVSRNNLSAVLVGLNQNQKQNLLVIHDEVHGLGSPSNISALKDRHLGVRYILGLSATPERVYDENGTLFIETEIGKVIYQFDLADAIKAGILCGFNYIPISYELSDNDKERLKNVWARKTARAKTSNPMTMTEVWIELSKVHKTAEMKPDVFEEYLDSNQDILQNTIIFVETMEYGERILPSIHRRTLKYKTYYADDEEHYLQSFAEGKLDCLVTCHKLSEGIDIPHLQNVILFSSARARLETVQRIGRCLRIDQNNPGKIANIVDFVADTSEEDDGKMNADSERSKWLSELSKVRRDN